MARGGDEGEVDLRKWTSRQLGIPQVEQRSDHDCGPAVVEAVLRYWLGAAIDKDMLERALGTTRAHGTGPGALVDGLRACGLDARSKQGCSMSELAYEVERGTTCILDVQAWAGSDDPDWASQWAHGHYVVLVGQEAGDLLLMDPSTPGARASLPAGDLEARWHDEEPGGRRTRRLAIFARGNGQPKGAAAEPPEKPRELG